MRAYYFIRDNEIQFDEGKSVDKDYVVIGAIKSIDMPRLVQFSNEPGIHKVTQVPCTRLGVFCQTVKYLVLKPSEKG